MYDIKQLFSALFETFDKSAVDLLRSHVRSVPLSKRWNICADYCLGDPARPNDVFAFTLIPGVESFETLSASIQASVPADLKKSKKVTEETIAFLRRPGLFHIAFVFDENANVFDNGLDGPPPSEVAKEFTSQLASLFRSHERGKEAVQLVEALSRDALRRSFNRKLLQRLYFLSVFFAFCSLVVARERNVSHAWFSDQDNMTTGFGGLIWHLALETLHGIGRDRGIKLPKSPVICVPTSIEELRDAANSSPISPASNLPRPDRPYMWFDELVRLPDHIAGVLATYNLHSGDVQGGGEKHITLTRDFLAEARNLAVIRVKMRDGLQFSRVTFHKAPGDALPSTDEGDNSNGAVAT